jgi:hypothetical protein
VVPPLLRYLAGQARVSMRPGGWADSLDDMEMVDSFNAVKAQYGADSSFMSFEARKVTELGDTLDQLRVSNPPVLAVIRGTGEVAQLYTGWISRKVMEQVVSNAVRGR